VTELFQIQAEDDKRVVYAEEVAELDASGAYLGAVTAFDLPWRDLDPKICHIFFDLEMSPKAWRRWPDFMAGRSYPWASIVSARVHDVLRREGFSFKSCPARPAPRGVRLPVDDEVRQLVGTDASADRQSNLPPGVEMPMYYAVYPEPGLRYYEGRSQTGAPDPRETIRACLSIIDASRVPLTVAQLASLVGVSGRAVQQAFAKHLGITPKAYLKARRLNAVRTALRLACTDVCIADVAGAHGFWHMGQFAADYRRMFGERPSETMSTAPTPASACDRR
jgi:AraC-like DNA-binding protein